MGVVNHSTVVDGKMQVSIEAKDAAFIAAARSFVPDALDQIERMDAAYDREYARSESLAAERYQLRTDVLALEQQVESLTLKVTARDAEVETLKHRLCELEVGDACFTPTHADVYLSVCKERDALKADLATLRGKVTERITKWRTDAESYPGTVVGQYASTAVKLCADELQVDMDALAEAEGTPLQLFDPEEFERRVAFIEGPKR